MELLPIVQAIAIICAGMLAGIFFGDRAGAYYARAVMNSASVVQYQQILHAHYVRFMPALSLGGLLSAILWLVLVRAERQSLKFGLVAISVIGLALIVVLTRAISVPLNNQLMTWKIDAPPKNLRELWAPWERVNTIRAFVATVVLILEAAALTLAS